MNLVSDSRGGWGWGRLLVTVRGQETERRALVGPVKDQEGLPGPGRGT